MAMTPAWSQELPIFWRYAGADAALFCALIGLRSAERGAPGRELGVLSVPAPTLADQAEVAARSFKNHERRYILAALGNPRVDGWYSDGFLTSFSSGIQVAGFAWPGWAPLKAGNDPSGLNANHAANLRNAYRRAVDRLTAAAVAAVPADH